MKIPYANLLPDLSYAMTMNPKMKVLVQQGYFDLACPYGSVLHAINHLSITTELRHNVEIAYYEAGHMMYVHPGSMRKFAETTAAFIDGNSH
jgi:carboxypeptidase C (cathepsin A)